MRQVCFAGEAVLEATGTVTLRRLRRPCFGSNRESARRINHGGEHQNQLGPDGERRRHAEVVAGLLQLSFDAEDRRGLISWDQLRAHGIGQVKPRTVHTD